MGEDLPNRGLDLFLRPSGILALDKCRLVTAHGPVQAVRGTPSLFRRHLPQHRDLLLTCLLVRQHSRRLLPAVASATSIWEAFPFPTSRVGAQPGTGGMPTNPPFQNHFPASPSA